ncbi:3-keto-disaccharide hydrolase [Planctomycetes bacterium CA13]
MNKLRSRYWISLFVFVSIATLGCRSKKAASPDPANESQSETPLIFEPQTYEATADELLSARLAPTETSEGWIRLFDGHTLFGWEIAGNANWKVEDQTITVDKGDICLVCTSIPWANYELTLEFNADEQSNSGIFLRTPLQVEEPKFECYEVNIAGDDHPFPTGSIVEREKVSGDAPKQTFGQWRRMTMRMEGNHLQVSLDDKIVTDYTDPIGLPAGRIGLQHNQGRVAFRDIRLRPLGLKSLLDEELSMWKQYPEMDAEFTVADDGAMQVKGGSGQIETTESYDDFVLLAEYKLPKPEINSGIFFRCIPGDKMMGYECQVSNAMLNDLPLSPADCGTGGIFRRQDARVVAGEPDKWATVVLAAHGPKIAAWVEGVQVSNWQDDREENENPRKGKRLAPGTIIIQGHDETTDALFKQIAIATPVIPTPVIDTSVIDNENGEDETNQGDQ